MREDQGNGQRIELLIRFVIVGIGLGLLEGLWEASRLYVTPSVKEFLVVDSTYVIWFLAPLVDAIFFGIAGALLGLLAGIGKPSRSWMVLTLSAVWVGIAGAFAGWSSHFLHTHSVNFDVYSRARDILFPVIRFAIVFTIAFLVALPRRKRIHRFWESGSHWPFRQLAIAIVAVLVFLTVGIVYYVNAPQLAGKKVPDGTHSSQGRPNIVLITMDTVRADHLSAYGYSRDTTPNLARLAAKGVLFENAVSATSWTLPSLSAIFTGLLPHQSGANAFRPLNPGWKTIQGVLSSYGYATAGFNANYYYGESGWGLGSRFEYYDDDRTTLLYNLSRMLLGRVAVQPLYQHFGRYDAFYRRDAADLNRDVFRWLRHPRSRPFYIYINYFDAHNPYLPPSPYDRHFGGLPEAVIRHWDLQNGLHPRRTLPSAGREALMDGYDNSLFYLDAQIGRLIHFLKSTPAGNDTIIIVTADHGEAFGEHGVYHHGMDLHREEIHVPLIVYGPGIPAGRRISPPVPNRKVFATVIDMALGNEVSVHAESLARFWETDSPQDIAMPVVSELSSSPAQAGAGEISLTTAQWHYILAANGKQYLYDWATDAGEKRNLSSLPQDKPILDDLNTQLREIEANSAEPWIGTEYLFALGTGGTSAIPQEGSVKAPRLATDEVGAAQAYFRPIITMGGGSPTKSERDFLQTLPYQ